MEDKIITRSQKQKKCEERRQVSDDKFDANCDMMDHDISRPAIGSSSKDAVDVSCNYSVAKSRVSSVSGSSSRREMRSITEDLRLTRLNDRVTEEDIELKNTMEGELMALKAKAMKEEAELLERHSMRLMKSRKSSENRRLESRPEVKHHIDLVENRDDGGWAVRPEMDYDRINKYLKDCRADEDMGRFDLPKAELSRFSGDVSEYWNFIRQFEIHIESRIKDPSRRLLYLQNYCQGEARAAISGCSMLPTDEGYEEARTILKRLFGRRHVITRKLIDEVINSPKLQKYDEKGLTKLYVAMNTCWKTLKQMGYLADLNTAGTIQRIVNKLPDEMGDRWIRETFYIYEAEREPEFLDLVKFIDREAAISQTRYAELKRTAERSYTSRVDSKPHDRWRGDTNKVVHHVSKMTEQRAVNECCLLCKEQHSVKQCAKYIELSVPKRWETIKASGGCFSCLTTGHAVKACTIRKQCGINGCIRRHHPSLHRQREMSQTPTASVLNSLCDTDTNVSLGVIPVVINGPKGKLELNALLDTGANTTLITKDVIERLGVKGITTEIIINTIVGRNNMEVVKCDIQVVAPDGSDQVEMKGIFAVDKLPIQLCAQNMSDRIRKWPHLAKIPTGKSNSGPIKMIIGCDQPKAHWVQEVTLGNESQPFGMKTPLGWVILGPSQQRVVKSVNYIDIQEEESKEDEIECMIQRLYNNDFEDLGNAEKELSREEREAVKIVTEGTVEDKGQYIVPLPWKEYPPSLSNNRQYAIKRLMSLRKRFQANPELMARYDTILRDHVKKGYIMKEIVHEDTVGDTEWYLPHHPVFNPRKPDKLRIVFDCAAKYRNKSINDCLHQGPDTIANLVGVLIRFRRLPVVIIADIEEMFLQVKLTREDQSWMKFLWWKDGRTDGEIETFKMLVHPFGARSSPFCANYALRRTVTDHKDGHSPLTIEIADRNLYVDDCIASVKDVETAREVIREMTTLMKEGGFKLRKWMSNRREALVEVPAGDLAKNVQLLASKELPTERTLGVEWDAEYDQLRFTFHDNEQPNTRRGILSSVATIFDPLGLISPIILKAKLLLQSLCRDQLGWDQPLEGNKLENWLNWKTQMDQLKRLTFPRCIRIGEVAEGHIQLHVFADASEQGYGAVAYTRMRNLDKIHCNILMSKARVAPLKTVTIPRLELNAAVLAVRLSKIIMREFDECFEGIFFWTDSTIVLHYLHNTTSRFTTFVANRVQEILESTKLSQWRHVQSESNPADYASRGLAMNDPKLKLWINGPEFLRKAESEWPPTTLLKIDIGELETKKAVLHIERETPIALDRILHHYSDWFRMAKAVVWLRRFKQYLWVMRGRDGTVRLGKISVEEITLAERDIIKYVQKTAYPAELKQVTDEGQHAAGFEWRLSRLKKLCPEAREGLMVVGGRCGLAPTTVEHRHPVILPGDHPVTTAVVMHYHKQEGHAGVSHTLAKLREKYWVINGGATVKRVLRRCLICRRLNATASKQRMAELPVERVTMGWYPFQYVGMDYFGPFKVRRGRLIEKRYGCIFTCLQCRAVHLELAQSLSTDSFILALMRFVNRRGVPREISSDNGGNFIGAQKELSNWLVQLEQRKIEGTLIARKITWKFNPPLASHRGGYGNG